jgi:energy-coupling factor transporter ATP-binding protein EcfA2
MEETMGDSGAVDTGTTEFHSQLQVFMDSQPIIEFSNFTFQYFSQAEPTLHNINLKILPGQKILIVGPSGSGKSTLGHCLNGLIPFSYRGEITGSLKIKGVETADLDIFKLSKTIGTVLQDSDAQFVGLDRGRGYRLCTGKRLHPQQGNARSGCSKVAQMVDMETLLGSSPFELSGGQKQRTSLAGVMVDDVDILLFDEPLANLDPATGKTAIEIIDDIHQALRQDGADHRTQAGRRAAPRCGPRAGDR